MSRQDPVRRRPMTRHGTLVSRYKDYRPPKHEREASQLTPDMPIWQRMMKAVRHPQPALALSRIIEESRGKPYHSHVVALAKTLLVVDKALKP